MNIAFKTIMLYNLQNNYKIGSKNMLKKCFNIISLFFFLFLSATQFSLAFEIITIPDNVNAINLSDGIDIVPSKNGKIQLSTAASEDGIIRNIEVLAANPNTNPNWALFALRNESDVQLERLLVAPFFKLSGSKLINPDLGSNRLAFLTVSNGLRPTRMIDYEADVFKITIDPGATVTLIAELNENSLPELYLWKPEAYSDYINSFTLFRGIVLGISSVAAVFLTIMFVVKGRGVFPATAAFSWSVLAYLLIDFGVMGRLLGIENGSMGMFRAAAESALATTLFGFLFIYLNLHRWHFRFLHFALVLLTIFALLFGLAFFQPILATTIARIMMVLLGATGLILILLLGIRGYDRAVMILPTWIIFLAWLFYSFLVISGNVSNDIAQPSVAGGLVLIVMLIGFTTVQHAFSEGQVSVGTLSEVERRALALTGSGDFVFDWNIERDRISISTELSKRLGENKNTLKGSIKRFLDRVHFEDKERFRIALDTLIELHRGKINSDIRLMCKDKTYRSFRLKVMPVLGSNGQTVRIVGTLRDISDEKIAKERLLHDSVIDVLTGLPNKKLFMDRLERAIIRSKDSASDIRPAIFLIDIDKFSELDKRIGLNASDSVLLAVSRRISRLLQPLDSISRINADQFAVILSSEHNAVKIAKIAEQIKSSMKTPFNFGKNEITLSVSIGITIFDNSEAKAQEVLGNAELAMLYAKKAGGDRIEAYRASAQTIDKFSPLSDEDIERGIIENEFITHFQPIMDLQTNKITGAETLIRWEHKTRGLVAPSEFIPIAEKTPQIEKLGRLAFEETLKATQKWCDEFDVDEDFFVSLNLSPRQLANEKMLLEIKSLLSNHTNIVKHLKLEVTESQIMANAEHSAYMLSALKSMGLSLALDDFGTGYSSLSYLHRFPFDTIKIPAPFVQINKTKGLSHTQLPIIKSIIALANDLGMKTIAEGIETKEELERLVQLNCKYGQGFYFSNAISYEDFRKKLASQFKV